MMTQFDLTIHKRSDLNQWVGESTRPLWTGSEKDRGMVTLPHQIVVVPAFPQIIDLVS